MKGKKPLIAIMQYLADNLEYGTNFLINKDGLPYKASDLAEEVGVSWNMANRYLKAFEEYSVIKKVRFCGKAYYIMNPHIYFSGKFINKATLELFKDYENTEH